MAGFTPPPYPYDRLAPLHEAAAALPGGVVDLSIGTPCDPPPALVAEALADADAARSYPPSVGTPAYREAAAGWLRRRFDAEVGADAVAACMGTKELVAGVPHWLRLRTPERDTVLYPEISYPTYAMGATLAGGRAVSVAVDEQWRIRLDDIAAEDAKRALCLWVTTPGNPAGGVPVFSDECYAEFTWDGPGRSILSHGVDGVVAVHSLSKRSNFAGARVGFYAGDADLVRFLSEVRKHAGFMVPGPMQLAGAAAWTDDAHVEVQRGRYHERLEALAAGLRSYGLDVTLPGGAFYLWVAAPGGDAWALAGELARRGGLVVSPGEFYGPAGSGHVRVAAVQPLDRIELGLSRLLA